MFRINDEVSLRKHSHCKFEVYFAYLTHFNILRGKSDKWMKELEMNCEYLLN